MKQTERNRATWEHENGHVALSEEVEQYRDKIRAMEETIDTLHAIKRLQEQDIEDWRKLAESRVEEIHPEFMRDYKCALEELDGVYEELAELRKKNEEQAEQIERMTTWLIARDVEIDKLTDTVDSLEKQCDEKNQKLDEVYEELGTVVNENHELREALLREEMKKGDAYLRLTPEKPIEEADDFGDRSLCCPHCLSPVTNYWAPGTKPMHCQFCGQALDWGEEDEK